MAAYLVALLLVGGSMVVGRAICAVCGGSPVAVPVVGFAALTAVASLGVRLPGNATTSGVLVAAVVVVALVWLQRSGHLGLPSPTTVLTGGLAAAVGAIPFVSTGTIGILGVSVNNDTGVHLLWAEGLRSVEMGRLYPANDGYPLGPHSLLATLASATGADMDRVLTALVIATPILFALTARGVLRRGVPWFLAVPAAVAVAFTYLQAAWYGQSSFKEPLMALLLLGFVVSLESVLRRGRQVRPLAAAPLGVLVGAALLIYSHVALVWMGLAGLLLVLFVLVGQGRPSGPPDVAVLRRAAATLVVGAGVAVLSVAVELPRLVRYATSIGASPADGGIREEDLGNLVQPLETGEALGIWPVADWRFSPAPGTFLLQEWKALALLAATGGALLLVARRREAALPAALAASALVVAVSSNGQSPYVTAKALAILAPFVTLVIARALLTSPSNSGERKTTMHGASLAVGVALLVVGGLTSTMVLRWTPVESPAQRDQLADLRPVLGNGSTLVLVADDYAGWRLRGVPVAYVGGFPSPLALTTRLKKPYVAGQALDWDNVEPTTLDQFDAVVTARSPFSSEPPPNFRLLKRTTLFAAWKRTGPTPPREVLETAGEPAAALDCTSPSGRRLSRRDGIAAVRRTVPRPLAAGLPPIAPGGAVPVEVSLPRGAWSVSIQYTSQVPMRLQLGRRAVEVAANTTRPGTWWPALRLISTGGPQQLLVIAERASRLTPSTIAASVSGIVAVRDEQSEQVPLGRACGRTVDWYRLGGSRPGS